MYSLFTFLFYMHFNASIIVILRTWKTAYR